MTDLSFVSIRQSKNFESLSCINNFLENIEDIAIFLKSLEKYMKGR
jgi:hypothetical protein